ncbi:ABC-2 type transport system permease protein [Tumebacillus sp. BK434]|uniref:ABC transporter permease n=1 Tax=Tumebacillus sp. BK434 TaxID=2512169 RepID=UPI001046FF24|nr:ABC transporter permease [Tumebacillus sp. BK434]TCP55920.1 ABC-2 type transport system permease protein [Tumebacillus sp. BK434]
MTTIKQFQYVFKMQFMRNSGNLMFFSIIQIMVSLGIVIGFTYLFDNPEKNTILFLATGAPTLILIITGLVILPQQIANAKTEGYIEFIRTWPVNRGLVLAADTLSWLIITIPGIAISTLVAHYVYDPGYDISWTVLPVIVLIALTSIGVGYGFSYALSPLASMALSQVLIFGALMFSPINFPMERLPEWLQTLHHILPLYSMAEVMRASMAENAFTAGTEHYITLIIWGILGYGGAILILNRK